MTHTEENIIVKTCKTHGDLTINDVVSRDKKSFRCKACRKSIVRNNYLKNKEKILERNNQWRLNSPKALDSKTASRIKNAPKHLERNNARHKKWRSENRDKYLKSCNKSIKNKIDNLLDPYIKHLIVKGTSLSYHDIPQEMVDLKRSLVEIKRTLAGKINGKD